MSMRLKWIALLGVMSLPFVAFAGWMLAIGAYALGFSFLVLLALAFVVFARLGLRRLQELDRA